MRSLLEGKYVKIRWYEKGRWYWFFDRYHLIIEIGRLSLVWLRTRK